MDVSTATNEKKKNISILKITNREALKTIESNRKIGEDVFELFPWAIKTPYTDIAEGIFKDNRGDWKTPLYFTTSYHRSEFGVKEICYEAEKYIKSMPNIAAYEILSISAYMENGKIVLQSLVRSYGGPFSFVGFFDHIHDDIEETEDEEGVALTGKLVIPEEAKQYDYSEETIERHKKAYEKQEEYIKSLPKGTPYLNSIKNFVPKSLPKYSDKHDLIYDLKTSDEKIKTKSSYEDFTSVFKDLMRLASGVEYHTLSQVIRGEKSEEDFMGFMEAHIEKEYVKTGKLPPEDVNVMLKKLHRSLFQLYIIQDLIDDPDVTDIKITAPDSIRTRIHGKAYITNLSFIDLEDYLRFIDSICIRNNISQLQSEITFTDQQDDNYILRFTLTSDYVTSVGWPYLHIRKIDRNKLLGKDLIELGMMDEKIYDYLMDRAKTSKGVGFFGMPGSGKTICLNMFLEEGYEQSAEILVIQENDELFAYRKGVMFQHPVTNDPDRQPVTLGDLGRMALVAGANVFVIGESKGPEICDAITLANAGCRVAITAHTNSAEESPDKMVDLALGGYNPNTPIEVIKKRLQVFETLVYLKDFKIEQIAEVRGFDPVKGELIIETVYDRTFEVNADNEAA
nr:ATPase, T2SS/T4P/T4SS family [uncultured Butyrivibrio sp.]